MNGNNTKEIKYMQQTGNQEGWDALSSCARNN